MDGAERIGWDFLTSYPSRKPELAGILPALVGSVYVIGLTGIIALPLGVGAAIYLEEYGTDSWLAQIIEVNIANLAGVPSIIYGLLGLEPVRARLRYGAQRHRRRVYDGPLDSAHHHHRLTRGPAYRPILAA